MAHKDEVDCNCITCYAKKHADFMEGKEVRMQGKKVVGFIDISIVDDDGFPRASIGLTHGVGIEYVLVAIGALAYTGVKMQTEDFPEVPKEEGN